MEKQLPFSFLQNVIRSILVFLSPLFLVFFSLFCSKIDIYFPKTPHHSSFFFSWNPLSSLFVSFFLFLFSLLLLSLNFSFGFFTIFFFIVSLKREFFFWFHPFFFFFYFLLLLFCQSSFFFLFPCPTKITIFFFFLGCFCKIKLKKSQPNFLSFFETLPIFSFFSFSKLQN